MIQHWICFIPAGLDRLYERTLRIQLLSVFCNVHMIFIYKLFSDLKYPHFVRLYFPAGNIRAY